MRQCRKGLKESQWEDGGSREAWVRKMRLWNEAGQTVWGRDGTGSPRLGQRRRAGRQPEVDAQGSQFGVTLDQVRVKDAGLEKPKQLCLLPVP